MTPLGVCRVEGDGVVSFVCDSRWGRLFGSIDKGGKVKHVEEWGKLEFPGCVVLSGLEFHSESLIKGGKSGVEGEKRGGCGWCGVGDEGSGGVG